MPLVARAHGETHPLPHVCSRSTASLSMPHRALLSAMLPLAVTLLLSGCRFHRVDTWEEWCIQLEGRTPRDAIVSFDQEAIRSDFVTRLNSMLVAGIADKYLAGADPEETVVRELVRLQMIGAWADGTTLHIANSMMYVEPDLGLDEWETTIGEWTHLLAPTTLRSSLSPEKGCRAGTVNGVFDSLVLHGPEGTTATIVAQHTLRE